MKTFLATLFFSLCSFIIAQDTEFRKVDYKTIEKEIKNKNSEYYYSTLMDRFQKMDTTLTKEHMYRLYYGYSFQKNFDVFDIIEHPKKIQEIEQKNSQPNKTDIETLKKYYTSLYKEKPFVNINSIETLAIIYSLDEDETMVKKLLKMYYTLIDAILLTGDGKSMENAIDVINARHEYTLINLFGLKVNEQALLNDKGRSYDLLSSENEDGDKFDVYFDVTRSFEFYSQKFK
ncbi:DUF4919 domain-containing protein [Empedobacter brevis]|uniref:DUF4919 domain-containing protein n=1 Tax=Empedobacter brevis NBRC 14943 = ATCC 43319 TaxID=1218108 RepID=A0A511NKW1_9FLAO|nr:DUF4919 domain-containing protein [Empedobacter brevis]QHC83594.1 hypothetical protein AS589_01705 [Empedobacter brevis]GEM53347.1 DUF4919 domain-containing protein [Empedobacter brevis NBRC 14943 = ATCC 43319]